MNEPTLSEYVKELPNKDIIDPWKSPDRNWIPVFFPSYIWDLPLSKAKEELIRLGILKDG